MSNRRLRELQRQAQSSDDPEALAALIRKRVRLGLDLSAARVAALCGDARWQSLIDLLPELRSSTQETAQLFGVQPSTIGSWCRKGCPHERQGRALQLDLGRVHRWRLEGPTWATVRGLWSFLEIVERCGGHTPALLAATHAVAWRVRSRWSTVLSLEARQAAEGVLLALPASPDLDAADRAHIKAALRYLRLYVPYGSFALNYEEFHLLLPLQLLGKAWLSPPDQALYATQLAAHCIVPDRVFTPPTGTRLAIARDALAASRKALLAWARAEIDSSDPLSVEF